MDLSILNEEELQLNYMMMDLSNKVDFISTRGRGFDSQNKHW